MLQQALRGALHEAPAALRRLRTLVMLGGGGMLGSAVLAEALVAGRFQRVQALVVEPLASALRGFDPLTQQTFFEDSGGLDAEIAVMTFERTRHSNGRDDAFLQPEPDQLLALAQRLHTGGVRHLIVVLPHAPALLPQALRHGLASLDEAAVAALGFEHLVFVRAAQQGSAAAQGSRLQRFAAWWLSQLRLMVPQQEQPVRAVALARCVVQLARQLPDSPPGTRVLAPERLWQTAQNEAGLAAAVSAWISTRVGAG